MNPTIVKSSEEHMDRDRAAASRKDDTFALFFDGGCPLCRREVHWMKRWDRRGRLRFIDIDSPSFDAGSYGLRQEDLMKRIHGQLPDGTLVRGVDVFREAYARLGFAPLVTLSRLKPIAWLLDIAYDCFARNRLRLTGRCTRETCARPT
jgi:predicted DCC family thiol-disulfide oxidoreductase YuxK